MEACKDVREVLGDVLRRRAESADTGRVERHLTECPACRLEAETEKALAERLHGVAIPPAPPSLSSALDRILRPVPATIAVARVPWFRPRLTLAAAAGVLLAFGIAFFLSLPGAPVPAALASAAETYQGYLDGRIAPASLPANMVEAFEQKLAGNVNPGVRPMEAAGFSCAGACTCACGCGCGGTSRMILYRRAESAVGLVAIPSKDVPLDPATRRKSGNLEYHAFRTAGKTILACPCGPDLHVWVSSLPEKELVQIALAARGTAKKP
ncbi:MAG: zf-HC2 domain-containing protein [Planctomycetota bacterium]